MHLTSMVQMRESSLDALTLRDLSSILDDDIATELTSDAKEDADIILF